MPIPRAREPEGEEEEATGGERAGRDPAERRREIAQIREALHARLRERGLSDDEIRTGLRGLTERELVFVCRLVCP